ncbi:MAG: hypothetical protein JXO49_08800 [Deltaproteobacteria bacterium]|nr:hypothetical protein [Candidatus Anaeroferrophillus wilburensis]MBN2889427.1 hypothetical protein [Deltaproteobacteria bacterium]
MTVARKFSSLLIGLLLVAGVLPIPGACFAADLMVDQQLYERNPFIPLLVERRTDAAIMPDGLRPSAAEEFSLPPDLKLKAVIRSGVQIKAIVGNQLVVSGDMVMGFKVASVQPERVILLKNGHLMELTLLPMVSNGESFTISAGGKSPEEDRL